MKKVFLVWLLLFLTIFCFTQEVTVTGSSEVEFGINLDEGASGFLEPVNTSTIQLNFLTGEDREKGAERDVYGYIKLSGFGISVNNEISVVPPVVEAKIVTYGTWVMISSSPETKVNYINPLEDDDDDDDTVDEGVTVEMGKSGGFLCGYTTDNINVEIGIVSENDWKDDSVDPEYDWVDDDDDPETPPIWGISNEGDTTDVLNSANAYGLMGKLGLKNDIIDCEVSGLVGINYVDSVPVAIGGKFGLTVSVITVNMLTDVSFDEDIVYEVGGGISCDIGVILSADMTYNESDDIDTIAKIVEATGEDGALKTIGFELSAGFNNLLSDIIGWNVDGKLDYTVDKAVPYVLAGYGSDEALNIGCGIELAVLENAKINLDYTCSDILTVLGTITAKVSISY